MMYKDVLSEMQYGDEAVKILAKLIIRPHEKHEKLHKSLILGIGLSPDTLLADYPKAQAGHDEMWECEIIIVPKRKYQSQEFIGWLAEDLFTSDAFRGYAWEKQIFGEAPPKQRKI